MLRLPDQWVWDSWLADDGDRYHLFFLHAARALLDPHRRHTHASIGHAVSTDLASWSLLPDALVGSDEPAWDDLSLWTGSVIHGPDGRWLLYYSALSRAERGRVQRIGLAVSTDLISWQRWSPAPVAEADPRWYETLDSSDGREEAWRDPWLVEDPGGDGWHMLVTARANTGAWDRRGVIGHARSADLVNWEVQRPLTRPAGFYHLEVPQVAAIDGHQLLIFSCMAAEVAPDVRSAVPHGGIWVAPAASPLGPFDLDLDRVSGRGVRPFDDPSLYSGRLVRDRAGRWVLLGFVNFTRDGRFIGEICDPIPVSYHPELGLTRQDRVHGPGPTAAAAEP